MTSNSRQALSRAMRVMVETVANNAKFQMTGADFKTVRFSCTGLAELPAHPQYHCKMVRVDFIPMLTTEFSKGKKLPYTQVPMEIGLEIYLADIVFENDGQTANPRWQEIDQLDGEQERLGRSWMDQMTPHLVMDAEYSVIDRKVKVAALWLVSTDLVVSASVEVPYIGLRGPDQFPPLHPGATIQMETLEIIVDTMVVSTEHLFTARNKAQAFWYRAIGEAWDAMLTQSERPHGIRLDENFYVLNLKPRSIGNAPAVRDPEEGKSKTERTVRRQLL